MRNGPPTSSSSRAAETRANPARSAPLPRPQPRRYRRTPPARKVATIYTIKVSRAHSAWVADVENLDGAHTCGKDLVTLRHNLSKAIRIAADRPHISPLPTPSRFVNVPASVRVASGLGEAARLQQEHPLKHLPEVVGEVVRQLADDGISRADSAALLRLPADTIADLRARRPHPARGSFEIPRNRHGLSELNGDGVHPMPRPAVSACVRS